MTIGEIAAAVAAFSALVNTGIVVWTAFKIAVLERNTNSIKDELVAVTHREGVLQGRNEERSNPAVFPIGS